MIIIKFNNNHRLNKDIQNIDSYGISIIQVKYNKLIAFIDGPDETPYANIKFKFSIELDEYPNEYFKK